jgi:hypothetical protein
MRGKKTRRRLILLATGVLTIVALSGCTRGMTWNLHDPEETPSPGGWAARIVENGPPMVMGFQEICQYPTAARNSVDRLKSELAARGYSYTTAFRNGHKASASDKFRYCGNALFRRFGVPTEAPAKPRTGARAATSCDTAWTLLEGSCTELLATLEAATIDAVVTDPPYGIGFQGHARARPSAASALAAAAGFPLPGVVHRVDEAGACWCSSPAATWSASALRAPPRQRRRGRWFEVRDTLMWPYGQGFPKSRNLTGALAGWGTALKPAYEPILLARKPLEGTTQQRADALALRGIGIAHKAV